MTARAHASTSWNKTAFHADQFAIATYGAAISDSGVEPCADGWRLWIETEQGDIHSHVYPSAQAAHAARDLYC